MPFGAYYVVGTLYHLLKGTVYSCVRKSMWPFLWCLWSPTLFGRGGWKWYDAHPPKTHFWNLGGQDMSSRPLPVNAHACYPLQCPRVSWNQGGWAFHWSMLVVISTWLSVMMVWVYVFMVEVPNLIVICLSSPHVKPWHHLFSNFLSSQIPPYFGLKNIFLVTCCQWWWCGSCLYGVSSWWRYEGIWWLSA